MIHKQAAPLTPFIPFSVEKKEASLKKMLATVLKDKEKIEQTIDELDRYKLDALEKTWSKVNGYAILFFLGRQGLSQ